MKIDFTWENFLVIGLMAILAFVLLEAGGYFVSKSGLVGSTSSSKNGG